MTISDKMIDIRFPGIDKIDLTDDMDGNSSYSVLVSDCIREMKNEKIKSNTLDVYRGVLRDFGIVSSSSVNEDSTVFDLASEIAGFVRSAKPVIRDPHYGANFLARILRRNLERKTDPRVLILTDRFQYLLPLEYKKAILLLQIGIFDYLKLAKEIGYARSVN